MPIDPPKPPRPVRPDEADEPITAAKLKAELADAIKDGYWYCLISESVFSFAKIALLVGFLGSVLALVAGAAGGSPDLVGFACLGLVVSVVLTAVVQIVQDVVQLLAVVAVELRLIRKRLYGTDRDEVAR